MKEIYIMHMSFKLKNKYNLQNKYGNKIKN